MVLCVLMTIKKPKGSFQSLCFLSHCREIIWYSEINGRVLTVLGKRDSESLWEVD